MALMDPMKASSDMEDEGIRETMESSSMASMKMEVQEAKEKVAVLQDQLQLQSPTHKIGVTIRRGWIENVKQYYNGGKLEVFKEKKVNQNHINARNAAAHEGDFLADRAIALLRTTTEVQRDEIIGNYALEGFGLSKAFLEEFLILEISTASELLMKVVSMRGTMVSCYAFTKPANYTDQKGDHGDFLQMQRETIEKWYWYTVEFSAEGIDIVVNAFEEDEDVKKALRLMQGIVDRCVQVERGRKKKLQQKK